MKDNNKISVIIPCYNTVTYLRMCVQSVISNVGAAFDITIVDDCSDDGSYEMANELAGIDDRIQVVHHTMRMGQGISRYDGFVASNGEWCLFLDSDDIISPNALSGMLQHYLSNQDNSDVDIIAGKTPVSLDDEGMSNAFDHPETWQNLYGDVDQIGGLSLAPLYREIYVENNPHNVTTPLCGSLIRRSLIDKTLEYSLRFKDELPFEILNDSMTPALMWLYARKLIWIKAVVMLHRARANSISSSLKVTDHIRQWTKASFAVTDYIRDMGANDYYKHQLLWSMNCASSMYWRILNGEEDKAKRDRELADIRQLVRTHTKDFMGSLPYGRPNVLYAFSSVLFCLNQWLWVKTIGNLHFKKMYNPYGNSVKENS